MSDEERLEVAPVNFEDHRFIFGLQVVGLDPQTEEVKMRGLPPEVGAFVVKSGTKDASSSNTLHDCRNNIHEATLMIDSVRTELESGTVLCVNPTTAQTGLFRDTQQGDHRAEVEFVACADLEPQKGVECMTGEDMREWLHLNHVHLNMYSNRFQVDFSAKTDFVTERFF